MVISRGLPALRLLQKISKNSAQVQTIRNSGAWSYRSAPPDPPKNMVLYAELAQGFMWWWILWHFWTEPGHIFGEFEYPDASKWTDEELGIPPL